MANKRIKDLSTTAAVTASDDFIAVDGATNGTRKLDAYSPTFGGNLTVSGGTIGTAAATNLTLNGGSSGASLVLGQGANAGGTFTNKGTGFFTFNGPNFSNPDTGGTVLIYSNDSAAIDKGGSLLFGGSYTGTTQTVFAGLAGRKENATAGNYAGYLQFYTGTQASALEEVARLTSTGNFLIGGTIDGGNGKLQLATHTTSAGGIGFGTDVSLYRSGADQLTSNSSGTANNFFLRHSTTAAGGFQVQIDSSKDVYLFQRENRPMYIGTNNVTALTLDSSQRTFTASAAKIGSLTGTVDSRLHVYESTAVSDSNGLTLEQASTGDSLISFLLTGVQRWSVGIDNSDSDKFKIGTGNLGAADKFTVDTSGNATVAGAIAIGNTVNTVSPTSPNRTITMVIGGTTYYIHAKTTND